ncbi:MAG: hypothetical protein JSS76_10120 [Bacteroidetes bacterium]|nr:hypothetical protein [Bacteroidota bacterium]
MDTLSNFISKLKTVNIRGAEIVFDENKISLQVSEVGTYTLFHADIIKLISIAEKNKVEGNCHLIFPTFYESQIIDVSEGRVARPLLLESKTLIEDQENNITYELFYGSHLFVLNYILKTAEFKGIYAIYRLRRLATTTDLGFLDIVGVCLGLRTLKIRSTAPMKITEFKSRAKAFLFNVNYNVGVSLIESGAGDSNDKLMRLKRYRKSRIQDIDPPRRIYIDVLVDHFLMAQSSINIMAVFLSYYHIIEHFFNQVFDEYLVHSVKARLTSSSFSYKKSTEIRKLIRYIQGQTKVETDGRLVYSELQALYLVLDKMVDFSLVSDELDQYDLTLKDYYKTSVFLVSDKGKFNLQDISTTKEVVIRAIANRIYGLRNAIVHSKEGGGDVYKPFIDDNSLAKEIPLLRFIAEEVIRFNSRIIE